VRGRRVTFVGVGWAPALWSVGRSMPSPAVVGGLVEVGGLVWAGGLVEVGGLVWAGGLVEVDGLVWAGGLVEVDGLVWAGGLVEVDGLMWAGGLAAEPGLAARLRPLQVAGRGGGHGSGGHQIERWLRRYRGTASAAAVVAAVASTNQLVVRKRLCRMVSLLVESDIVSPLCLLVGCCQIVAGLQVRRFGN